jgi:hypothetical protein
MKYCTDVSYVVKCMGKGQGQGKGNYDAKGDGIPPHPTGKKQPRRTATFRGFLPPRGGFVIQHGKSATVKVAWADATPCCCYCDAIVCCVRTRVVPGAAQCTHFDPIPLAGNSALHAAVTARMSRPGGEYAPVDLKPPCGETITFNAGELPAGGGLCGTKGLVATPPAVEALIDAMGARSSGGVGIQCTYLGAADTRKRYGRNRSVASTLGGGGGGGYGDGDGDGGGDGDGMVGTIVLFGSDCSHDRLLRVAVSE